MGEKEPRNRKMYLILIVAGLFLLLNKIVANPGTMISLFMLILGIYSIRSGMEKKGYILLGIGAIILISSHLAIIIALILMSLGFFYMKARQTHGDGKVPVRQRLIESLKRDKEPWVLSSMSLWYVIGELHLDFSLAIPEEKEVTLILQGVIGDLDLFIPEDWGVSVQSSVFFGQLSVAKEKESGVMNKIYWQSPNFDTAGQRVKLIVSYIVGDIDIKVME